MARNQLAGIIVLYPMAQIPKLNELAGKVPVISIGDKPGSYHFAVLRWFGHSRSDIRPDRPDILRIPFLM